MLSDFAASSLLAAVCATLLSPLNRISSQGLPLVAYPEPTPVECTCRCEAAKAEESASFLLVWAPYLWGLLLFIGGASVGCCARSLWRASGPSLDRGPRRGVWTQVQKSERVSPPAADAISTMGSAIGMDE